MVTQRTTRSHGFWTSLHRRVSYKNTLNSLHPTHVRAAEYCLVTVQSFNQQPLHYVTVRDSSSQTEGRPTRRTRRQKHNKSHKMSNANEDLVIIHIYLETSTKTHFVLFILTHFDVSFSRAELVLLLLWDLLITIHPRSPSYSQTTTLNLKGRIGSWTGWKQHKAEDHQKRHKA